MPLQGIVQLDQQGLAKTPPWPGLHRKLEVWMLYSNVASKIRILNFVFEFCIKNPKFRPAGQQKFIFFNFFWFPKWPKNVPPGPGGPGGYFRFIFELFWAPRGQFFFGPWAPPGALFALLALSGNYPQQEYLRRSFCTLESGPSGKENHAEPGVSWKTVPQH